MYCYTYLKWPNRKLVYFSIICIFSIHFIKTSATLSHNDFQIQQKNAMIVLVLNNGFICPWIFPTFSICNIYPYICQHIRWNELYIPPKFHTFLNSLVHQTMNQWWLEYRRIYASLGLNDLIISYKGEIALRWTPQNPTDDKATLVKVMACCRQSTSHYLS